MKAFWTSCGQKVWPNNAAITMIVQAAINQGAPEKAADLFLYASKVLFHPSVKTTNKYLVRTTQLALREGKKFEVLRDVFKRIEAVKTVGKDERSYLMAIAACRELKDWKHAYKFYKGGLGWLTYTEGMWAGLRELHEGLSPEESDLFISLPRINGKLGVTTERKKRPKAEKKEKQSDEAANPTSGETPKDEIEESKEKKATA